MNNKKVIGIVSMDDPFHNRVAWSGTVYKLREAVEMAGFEVRWIPYNTRLTNKLLDYSIRIQNRIFRKKIWMTKYHFRPVVKLWAKEIDACPTVKECDYLFFPLGAQIAVYSKNGKPYINISGYTVPDMLNYYFYNVTKRSKAMALEMDAAAAHKAIVNIRSSKWANDGLINYYHCDSNKCHILEFGPNIDTKDIRRGQTYNGGQLKILFSGVTWGRKGGNIAVETTEILRSNGIDARLIVVGPKCCPNICKGKDYIDFIGYLNKNNADDYDKYLSLYENAHLLLLPTKAECGAIVYSEAAAAGIPCYTYLTGGAGNYVVNGINGYALPEGSPANAFAEKILDDIKSGRMPSLHEGALTLFNEHLSWEAWARGFSKIMQEATA
jgi:hypothetical protein